MTRSKYICGQLIHLADDIPLKAYAQIGVIFVKKQLKLVIGELVSWFELTIVLTPLLNCVVGQVHHSVGQVVDAVLAAGGSQVSLLVDPHLRVSVDGGHQHKGTDVKLATVDQ